MEAPEPDLFKDLLNAVVHAADLQTPSNGSLTGVNLSSAQFQALLSATVEEGSAPLRSLVDAISRAVNEHGDGDWTSVDLSGLQEFVSHILPNNGNYLRYASAALRNDREVVMVAAAQEYQCGSVRYATDSASSALRAEFEGDRIVTHVRNQLQLRSCFFGPFLCAIALPAPEAAAAAAPGGARCLLSRLNIGEESPIQQLIADFTGVAYGSSWRFVQLAAAHLAHCM